MVTGKPLRNKTLQAWLFIAPAICLIALVAFWPLLRTLIFAFTDAKLSTMTNPHWVGFDNFIFLLQDTDFWGATWNTLVFAVLSVSAEVILGLGIAVLLNQQFRGRNYVRTAVLIPWAIPTVVSAKLWAWMFNDLYGVINASLLSIGLINEPVAWLANPKLALFTIVFVDIWKTTPFVTLLLLAGLQGIPKNLYSAARIEGAGAWRTFFSITLPLLRPALFITIIFRTLDALRVFDLPYILTSNTRSTRVLSVFARQQLIDFQDIGYGSAASFLIFCVIGVFVLLYLAAGRKELGLEK